MCVCVCVCFAANCRCTCLPLHSLPLTPLPSTRRHPTDVIAGWLLGFSLGWLGYRLLYPNLAHPQCNVQSRLLRQGSLLAAPALVPGGAIFIRAPASGPKGTGRGPFSANSSGNVVGGGMGTPASLQPTSTPAHSRHSYLTGQGPT